MVAAAVSSSGPSQSVLDQMAAARAAEDARRAAEAEARRLAEEAARKAAEALRLAEEARKKAEAQRKAAEAAELKAAQSKAEADQAEAQKARAQAKADELDALKKEAASNLSSKESTLAASKLDDVCQSRAKGNPSDATRAAQSEVTAAQKLNALYETPAAQPGAEPPPPPSAGTKAALEKLQDAARPVFDAQARGDKATPAQESARNAAFSDWLEAAQQDMRTAGLKAQAQGKDPQAAIAQEGERVNKEVVAGGLFVPKDMAKSVAEVRDSVQAESPEVRQLRSEQYDVNQSGKQQTADARTEAGKAADAAAKAKADVATYGDGPITSDSRFTARENARAKAAQLGAASDQAAAKYKGLVETFGGHHPDDPTGTDPKAEVFGAVNTDYEARAADLQVQDFEEKYQKALAGGDKKKIDEADTALREAQGAQRHIHAFRDDQAAKVDLRDAATEYTDAEAAWNAEAAKRPGTYQVTERDGGKETTKTVRMEGYDPAFRAKPDSEEGKKVQLIDGKRYYVDGNKKTELDPITNRLFAAKEKRDAATARVGQTDNALRGVVNDLYPAADGNAPKLDASRYADADGINNRLLDANKALAAAYANVDAGPRPAGFVGPVATPPTPLQLGELVEKQYTAQAAFNAMKAMQELRGAERDQAAGKPVDEARLETLREAARKAQSQDVAWTPSMTPEQEKDLRDKQLPDARNAFKAKDEEYRKLPQPRTPEEEAARDKVLGELDTLKLTVRDKETQIELIDAKRDFRAAQYRLEKTTFAKPQLEMYVQDGETHSGDVYPQNYDPTAGIRRGADGKADPKTLPKGISPDDVKIELNPCGGGYIVTFKKDSKVVGLQESPVDGRKRSFVVKAGSYEMNPVTAHVWQTSDAGGGRLAKANDARNEVNGALAKAAAEAPPAENALPQPGPDGKPVPTLRMNEDLGPRKKTVDQGVVDAIAARDKAQTAYDAATGDRTRLGNDLADAKSRVQIAQNEQTAVNAVLAWQTDNRNRQIYQADERAGRTAYCYAELPTVTADKSRDKAELARKDWIDSRNKFLVDTAKRDLGLAQTAHDQWKSANPTLAETGSATWTALQDARLQMNVADVNHVAGAADSAIAREKSFISQNLTPDKFQDPRSLYSLFEKNPQVMAQSIINSHYLQYGPEPMQMQSRLHLENEVALALGWGPEKPLDGETAADNARIRQTQNLFGNLPKEQREMLDKAVDKLVETGGDKARVTVLPVVYALDGDKGGIVKTALFKVESRDKPGQVKFVDEQGWRYDDLDDYRANNSLPVEDVNLVTAKDGKFSVDDKGNVELFSGDARTETDFESARRRYKLDWIAGGVGLVAGVVLTVGSFGTLVGPGMMLAAGSLTVLTAGYGVETSRQSLVRQADHGQSVNPFTNTQARMDWLNLGLSAFSVPVVGASTRAAMQTVRAGRALKSANSATGAAAEGHLADTNRYLQSAKAWGKPASTAAVPLTVGSVYAFEEGARYLMENWDHMTPSERNQQLGMLGLNAGGFATGVAVRGTQGGYNAVKTWLAGKGGPDVVPASHVTNGTPGGDVAASGNARTPAHLLPAAGKKDALTDFREASSLPADTPFNAPVAPLNSGGRVPVRVGVDAPVTKAPSKPVAEVPADTALNPVVSLALRRSSDDPGTSGGAMPASARRPDVQRATTAANDKGPAANAPQRAALERQRVAGNTGGSSHAWRVAHGDAVPLARDINPTGSDTNCVNSAVTFDRMLSAPGIKMQAVPSGPKTWAQILALYGDAPLSSFGSSREAGAAMSALPDGSRGFVFMGDPNAEAHVVNFVRRGGRTELVDAQAGRLVDSFDAADVKVMVTHEGGQPRVDQTVLSGPRLARFLDASADKVPADGPQGRLAGTPAAGGRPGFDADGVPKPPTTSGHPDWEGTAAHVGDLFARQRAAADPDSTLAPLQPSADETAVTASLIEDPVPGSADSFVLSKLAPGETIYGSQAGVRVPGRRTYDNFADAKAAMEREGGGWIHRVRPDPDKVPLGARRKVGADEIMGAVHVGADGQLMPIGIPNARDAATLAATTQTPSWKQGVKVQVSTGTKSSVINARMTTLLSAGARAGVEVLKPVFGLPAAAAGHPVVGSLTYGFSAFGRGAYLTGPQRMKESMAAATLGDATKAKDILGKVIKGSGWRGDKIMDEAKKTSLARDVDTVLALGTAFKKAREKVTGGPSEKDFRLHTIRSADDNPKALLPEGYLKDVPGVDEFLVRLKSDSAGEFGGVRISRIRDELLVRIDRMSSDELQQAVDPALPATTPEAQLLRAVPEVHAKFKNSVETRAAMREAHTKLYDKLLEMFPHDKKPIIDPKKAEDLSGSTNSPSTRLGKFSRRGTIALSTNVFLGSLLKPLAAGDSIRTFAGNISDSFASISLFSNYVYNNKVEKLDTIKAEVKKEADAVNKSIDEYARENPDLDSVKRLTEAQKNKSWWNTFRDYSGGASVLRAIAVGLSLQESGMTGLATLSWTQAGLTGAWIGLQQIPKFRNGAAPTLTKSLKWGAIGSMVVVPAVIVIAKLASDKKEEKQSSWLQKGWDWGTGLFAQDPSRPDQPVPTPSASASGSTPTPSASASVSPPQPGKTEGSPPPDKTPTPTPPKPTPILVTVDGNDLDTATLWGISEHNEQTLLTPLQLGEARREGGEVRVIDEALSQLFNLNPRFDRRLMDGVASNVAGDPDTLLNGWQIEVGQRPAT